MESLIRKCIKDMETVAVSGKYSLDAQVRAYDLLEQLLDLYYDLPLPAGFKDVAAEFCSVYEANASVLDSAFDSSALAAAAADVLKPLNEACNEARFEAAAAASLHEFAKEVFDIWQNSGVFARRRALKGLRQRAGFRLEAHRIGNYVAKTFDLQNEAASRFAKAQQTVYSSDVAYKIRPGLYAEISARLAL